MTNVRTIHVDWYSQRPPHFYGGPQLAYQGDHLSNMVVFDNAPELPNYYLLVEMKTDDTGQVVTLPAVLLEGPYWVIPNYYTQICQQITYQVCCKTGSGDYEHHSAKFKGTILPAITHNGEPIDQSAMFDQYIDILDKRVNELVVAAGDIQIDSELKSDSTNPVQNKVVKAAINGLGDDVDAVNGRLTQLNNRFEDGTFSVSELSEFRQGGIQTTTGAAIYQQYKYRVVSVDIIEFVSDVTLTIADGFRIAYMIFVEGEPSSFKSWFTGTRTFTAGQTVRMMIARVTEDTSEQADVEEFTSAVTFPYTGDVARRITFVENGMTALASDYTSLSATVEENTASIMNLSPKKQEDGYVYAPFIYPSAFDNDFKPVTVFYDGHEYFTDYKKENFRNSDGTSVIHVSPNGSASASGTTEETATTLTHAISIASANSRIILHDGFYLLTESEYRITKQLDLIGSGNVYLCFDTTVANPSLDNETGLYAFTTTGTFLKAVVKSDLRIILTKKDTLADCQLSPYSWYAGDGTIYFNLPYAMDVLLLADRSRGLTLQNTGAVGSEMKVYLENINFVGAKDVLYTSQYPGRILYLVLDSVNVLHSLGISIHVNGGKFLAHKSSCMYGVGDGFQYQVGRDSNNNPEPTWFMEIDCVGANLGTQGTQDSINGTTAHDVDKGIRVNGKYYNNMGGNCTDIGNTTQTVNLGCMADNSCGNTHKEGFSVQSALTEMWLYDCYASGNDADLQSQTGCFIYTHNCVFTTRRGNGTVEEISYP